MIDVWEYLRRTVPYDPQTPSEPGSAWDDEPDPFVAKELPPSPDSPPPPQPLRKVPAHNALVLEEVRQHANANMEHIDAPQSPEAAFRATSNGRVITRKDLKENPERYEEIGQASRVAEKDSGGGYLEEFRQSSPEFYSNIMKANIATDIDAIARQEAISKLPKRPTQPKLSKPRFNMEGILTAAEVLAKVREQLPPRPPSDSNSEPSDYWPWDSPPSTPTKVIDVTKDTPAPLPSPANAGRETPPPAPPPPIPNRHVVDKNLRPEVARELRDSLNDEIKKFSQKNLRKTGKAEVFPSEEVSQQEDSPPASQMKRPTQEDGRGHLEPGNEGEMSLGKVLGYFGNKIISLEQQVGGIQGKATDVEDGVTALDGKAKILENGITSLNSRTAGMDKGIIGLDLRVNGLENGVALVNDRTAGFEKDIAGLGGRTIGLENGFRSLDSRTAGFEKGIDDLGGQTSILENGISHWGERMDALGETTTKRLDGVDGRLTAVEGQIHGIEEIHEQTPALKKLLNDGREFGGHLQNLNDGLQSARVGISHLNEGYEGTRNALQNHAHHIHRLDNEIVTYKMNADQQHEEVVKRVDGLKKMLAAFGIGASAIALTGFGLWGLAAARKWMKKNREKKEFEAAARRGAVTGVGAPQMQQVGNGSLKKRRAHARQWTRLDV